ncbi:hypothetical protein SDC9_173776 [bioreactor metagenome]|uniref:Uncharacterized protein n=1 Tax=bioreactor metagenome TaxID=1076179 RepID=A0A645GKF9_9ZZZZ
MPEFIPISLPNNAKYVIKSPYKNANKTKIRAGLIAVTSKNRSNDIGEATAGGRFVVLINEAKTKPSSPVAIAI